MEILRDLLVFIHLLGMAIIIGSYFANLRAPRVVSGMLHGAYLQLVTGLLLVTVLEFTDGVEINHMKIGIKLVLAILVAVFAFIGARKEKAARAGAGAPARTDGYAGDTAPPAPVVHPSAAMAHLTFGAAVIATAVAVFV
ncbi:hypothetical protein MTQ12_12035 [Brevibacterium sp. R8603A2]|uniref:hypothetical protein n=1 Tax=Brevibacterium sp. R8603A2 TaxID=2929779 RepID=UPI001FFA10CC|nr:hypothetical protein [Brevibacterium sp. R8603A2]MCK1803769.1 hypothetical protein [Brevibacterium sp. R8603A2]